MAAYLFDRLYVFNGPNGAATNLNRRGTSANAASGGSISPNWSFSSNRQALRRLCSVTRFRYERRAYEIRIDHPLLASRIGGFYRAMCRTFLPRHKTTAHEELSFAVKMLRRQSAFRLGLGDFEHQKQQRLKQGSSTTCQGFVGFNAKSV